MNRVRWGAAIVVVAAAALVVLAARGPGTSAAENARKLAVGVVPQSELAAGEIRKMRAAGIESVRLWFPWSGVERVRDEYDWGAVDQMVRTVSSSGLTVLPFLFGSPEWAARRDGFTCDAFECIPYAPASIETRYAFARFAGAAAGRYGPGGSFWENNDDLPYQPIGAWQIWNEQNSQSFYLPDADPLAYAQVVELAGAEIHAADPEADVVLGGMFGPRSSSRLDAATRYLRELYAVPGVRDSFEGFAIHPYSPTVDGVISQIRGALRVVDRHRDDAALWISEIGWASSGERDERLVKTPKEQAELLEESFTRFADRIGRWRIRGVYWYAWRDTRRDQAVCAWCPGSGLVTRAGKAKPAYRMLRSIAR